jgi:hypothetical protein
VPAFTTGAWLGLLAVTVKVTGWLVPVAVVTMTLAAPSAALPAMSKVAVICVGLTMFMLLTAMPGLSVVTIAPAVKFAPARVIGTLNPAGLEEGVIDAIVTPVPSCSIVTVWSSTVIVPVLGPVLGLSGTEKLKDPLPVPEAGDVSVIQGELLTAVHKQSDVVLT